jgi:hypothetical protein
MIYECFNFDDLLTVYDRNWIYPHCVTVCGDDRCDAVELNTTAKYCFNDCCMWKARVKGEIVGKKHRKKRNEGRTR